MDPAATPDTELVRLAQAGDEDAFGQLVTRHMSLFFRVVQRILGDPGDTQDALQDALIAMHTQIRSFQGQSSFSTWGYRICVNKALMLRRSRIRRREDVLDEFMPRFAPDGHHEDMQAPLAWTAQAEAHALAEAAELRSRIMGALDLLTDDQRQVFVLKDLEDWDTDEIARHLDISRDLVRQRLHRARLALRGALAPFVTRRAS
ncbi:MAG TPA: sigma-70 family RNA polymerase sigma factor [Holophagaceae bacterium]|nr:sigma-70 family RNA polymerase sigma factor [Holophagaceae bacterium]